MNEYAFIPNEAWSTRSGSGRSSWAAIVSALGAEVANGLEMEDPCWVNECGEIDLGEYHKYSPIWQVNGGECIGRLYAGSFESV